MLKSRTLRWLAWAVGAAALLVLGAWLAVPPLLKWQLETRGSELLGRDLRVAEVKFSPFALALTFRQLTLAAAPGDPTAPPQLQIERLFVDISARTLLRLAPVIDAIEIDAPQLRLARLDDGRYDIDDLLQRLATPQADAKPDDEPQRFALFNLRLARGEVLLDDRPVDARHELRDIVLDLPFLSNLPDDLQVKVEPRLAFVLNGSAFDSRGRSTPFAQGRASEFDIRFDKLDLSRWWAYLPKTLPVAAKGGALDADLKLRFEQSAAAGTKLELQGRIALQDMAVTLPDDAPLLSWQSLRVQLADVQPLQRRVGLESVQLDGAVLHLRRDAAGALQLMQLADAAAPPAPAPAPAPAPPSPASAAASAATVRAGDSGWSLQLPLLALNGAQLHWHDASLQPAAEASLDAVQVRVEKLRWPVEGDAPVQLQAQLMAGGKAAGQLSAQGVASDKQARIGVRLSDVDLALAEPYLRQFLRPQASGRIQAVAEIDWAGGDAPRLALALPSASVDAFRLSEAPAVSKGRKAPAPEVLAQWQSLALADLRADLLQRRASLASLSLSKPQIALERDKAGTLSVEQWLVAPPPATAAEAVPAAEAPWRLELRELKLDDGRVRLADATLPAGALLLDGIRARAAGVAWPIEAGAKPMDTQFSASLSTPAPRGRAAASPARLEWRGDVGLLPAAASGRLRVERLPVHAFEPYFGAKLPVILRRAEAGFNGRVDLRQAGAAWHGGIDGEALIADLRIDARRAEAARSDTERELLSWNALSLKGLKVDVPAQGRPRLYLGQLRLSDFYAQLEVTEEGRLYLQTLAPGDAAAPAPAGGGAPGAAPPADAPRVPRSRLAGLPFDFGLEGAVFTNGTVEFNDRFIRPNYSAELSELFGRIGAFDSRAEQPASLQIAGVVAGTGVLAIEGAINPAIDPPSLDLKAKATGIELPGLTPYSAKYAGYPIERGKLSVDVAYKIDSDGTLQASNKIVVNQLTFGEKTDSADATTLPVRLAVALLQDRYGVIDIDLPVSGSINDPQFSIAGLVLKAIVNLLTKVLTAPFSMLSGGSGPDLSAIAFSPGSVTIDAAGQQVIDQVAVALADRPTLKLSVLGVADPATEKVALQQAALQARLVEEQRRERARGSLGSNAAALDAPLPPLTAEARAELLRSVYVGTALPGKPAGSAGPKADLPVGEMEAQLLASIPVDDGVMRQLAINRARSVRQALVAKGLSSDRLFLSEPDSKEAAAKKTEPKPMAQLSLSPL